MAGGDTIKVGVSVAAAAASGPIYEVFNELGALLAIMGGLGGALYVMSHGVELRQAVRPIATGALLAFGAGVWAVPILGRAIGLEMVDTPHTVPAMAGAAFFAGFLQERIFAKIKVKNGGGNG